MLLGRTLALVAAAVASASAAPATSSTTSCTTSASASASPVVNQTTCNGNTYIYQQLAGFGYIPSDARDAFGDTIGGHGSAIALDHSTWVKIGDTYTGILWTLPDRGWNTEGTLNYQNRVHKFLITLTLNNTATVANPSGPNLKFQYLESIRFTDPKWAPTSGLDANLDPPYLSFPGLSASDVPSVNFTGDGFGNAGPGGKRVVVDSEGLFLGADGTFWVSDEYGPYIYQFGPLGNMLQAIRPPNAFIPLRNNSESFSADSPPLYDPTLAPIPADNPTGRDNNQGFEGLTVSPDGKTLYALMQSALNQEGGLKNKNSRYARFVIYDISVSPPVYLHEYVVPEPFYPDGSKVAHQSEIHYLTPTQFLILARDSNAGAGQNDTQSVYRHADIFDISAATDIKGATADCFTCSIATSKGVLNTTITPAEYCTFLDYNVNSQLNRFGVHNGGAQDSGLLNEKWESLAMAPVNGNGADGEFFLFSLSDNDFITQNGYLEGGKFKYADASGFNLQNQALVFQVKIPAGEQPY